MLLNIGVPVFAADEPATEKTGTDFKTVAEEYYGENGTLELGKLSTSWGSSDAAEGVMAGQRINLQVEWTLNAAASYDYTGTMERLFDHYDDTVIVLTLPDGVSIVQGVEDTLKNVKEVIPPSDGSGEWQLTLSEELDAASSPNGTIIVPLLIEGNGQRAINKELKFDTPARLETSFTIMDRTDPSNHQPSDLVFKKTVTAQAALTNKKTITQDQWLIEKKAVKAVADSGKTQVTVTFELAVGLADSTGQAIATNTGTYGRNGRVPFDGDVILSEIPRVKDRDGNPIEATSITITPQFDSQPAIMVNPAANSPVSIPVDTCEGQSVGGTVAEGAPFLSYYTVEVVYPYDKFIANYYDANQAQLDVTNTVKLTYTLAGDTEKTAEDTASIPVGEVTQPACIEISKYLVDKDNRSKLYSAENFANDTVTGPATFAITTKDGGEATLYVKNDDNTYTVLDSNIVTIDPNGTEKNNSTTGSIKVYMDPGTYTVSETSGPSNTVKMTSESNNAEDKTREVEAGKTQTAAFYDKELLGYITVQKFGRELGAAETPLLGATFALYRDAVKIGEATTDSNGNAYFNRLPYGTYIIKEISAPDGYVIDSTEHPVEVSENDKDVILKVVNNSNLVPVRLQKQVFNGVEYVNVGSNYYQVFDKAFSLESSTDTGNNKTFTTVQGYDNLSLTENGTLSRNLRAYDAEGNVITYRFKEILPEGWHAPSNPGAMVMYSEEFKLTDYVGKPATEAKTVTMRNDRNGSIELTKEFYRLSASGNDAKQEAQETTFALYRVEKGSSAAAELVETKIFTGNVSFTDLARTTGRNDGTAYLYYLVETVSPAGYAADAKTTGNNTADKNAMVSLKVQDGTVQAWGPFDFTSQDDKAPASLSQTITVKNYEQKLPVTIKKEDAVTRDFVKDAKFTIYAYDNNVTGDAIADATDVEIKISSGVTVWLEAGKKYLVEETAVPQGYHDVTTDKVIDLTNYLSVDSSTDYGGIIKTLQNHPDPQLKINKTLVGSNGTQPKNGVEFEVYTETNGVYTRVKGYDGQSLTIKSGTATRLPAGTYWLKEVNIPNGVLDPSKFSQLYTKDDGVLAEDGSFYFGPVEVKKVTDEDNLTQTTDITNYADTGAVTVTKQAKGKDGKLTALSGATIAIYNQDKEVGRATSPANGKVTFTGLPIYDEEGNKITYTIKEIEAPKGYTVSDTVLTVELEAGKTVTGVNLTIVNLPEVSFQVTKEYYNIWENRFTQKSYLMPGAQIALYEKQDGDSYKLVKMLTTDDLGAVTFTGLAQDKEYVAVEYDIPEESGYAYLEPINGKEYLSELDEAYKKNPPATLTQAQLNQCYYVTKAANDGTPESLEEATLTNVEHWAQLHIEKYVLDDSSQPNAPSDTVNGTRHSINNANFELYMEILPEDTPTGTTLSFENNNLGKYTHIGSYSSGTLYTEDGVRQDGWFSTDILKVSNNVVYWLVETTGGTGARIDPENQITLITRNGTGYKNGSKSIEDPDIASDQVFVYKDDAVTTAHTQNIPVYGGGGDMFSTVRIAKWAGAIDPDTGDREKTYTPLGNATFDLYLVHKDGTIVEKLDTLTSGLDNDLTEADTHPETAWASSKSFSWKSIIEYENAENVSQDIWWTDSEENGYARVMLVESGTPAGYEAPLSGYRMLMYFDKDEGKTTEVFNDVYYVKDNGSDVELAENQGTDWALYPTKETSEGVYTPIEGVAGKQYRIVNWPVDNFAVTVTKYGYTYNEQTKDKTSQELDEYFLSAGGRTPIEVEMKLQRYTDGIGWQDYAYPNYGEQSTYTFTTTNGSFSFPKGLNVGRYRIIETKPDANYDNIYDGSSVTGDDYYNARAYYFRVLNDNVQITMYNPAKLSLSLKKTDTNDTALKDVTFALTLKSTPTTKLTATTGDDGVANFTGNVGTGVYVLSESAGSEYSNSYLSKYFQSAYADEKYTYGTYALKDFATAGEGIFLGYTTKVSDGQVVVTDSINLDDYEITEAELKVENPLLGSLTILKTDKVTGDAVTSDEETEPAVFKVEYKAFNTWSGEETVSDIGWNEKNNNLTTDADGKATLKDLQPGVYKITETKAPTGYDLVTTPQYVVLTGGMVKTVTIDGQTVPTEPTSATVTFTDPKKISLTVEKAIDTGHLTVEGEHTFSFTLYDANKKQIGTPQELTAKKGDTTGTIGSVTFDGLSQGATYYIKETTSHDDFKLDTVEGKDGVTVTKDGDYYQFTMPDNSNAGAAIKVTNTYMYAEVTVLKVNGNDGTPLDGAAFMAYRKKGNDFISTPTGVWTPKNEDTGEYTVRLPLTDLNGNTFKLQEWSAPAGYVLDYDAAEVTVEPGDSVSHGDYSTVTSGITDPAAKGAAMLNALIFPNYPGSTIHITKYNNIKGSASPAVLKDVTFTLYVKDTDGDWQQQEAAATDDTGTVTFTVNSNKVYAVTETVPAGYAGLQGLYDGDTAMPTDNREGTTYYLLNNGENLSVNNTYEYNAYNIPYVEMEIHKQDAANPNTNPAPTATVDVYEVDGSTPTTLTQQEVASLIADKEPVLTGISVNTQGASGGVCYSYANAGTHSSLGSTLVGGKTYLVIETNASLPQIRDNKQVVWYAVAKIPEGTTQKQIVTLKNLDASVSQSLTKTVLDGASNSSLLTQSATLRYELTPTVNNSYPLNSYVITDDGLSNAMSGSDSLDYDTYLKDAYSVEAVRVGHATHKTEDYAAGDYPISAKVTFYDFNNAEIKNVTVDVSETDQTVWLSMPDKKAKYVTVEYFNEDFKNATGYALGQNFMPGKLTVRIVKDKQNEGEAVQAITKVTNTAHADLQYRPWSKEGVQSDIVPDSKQAAASNTFDTLKTALISVTKTCNIGILPLDGSVATYTVTISNKADAEASMKQPFFVDLLPQGTVLNGDGNVKLIDPPEGVTIDSIRTDTKDGENALFVFLNGEIKPGQSVKVTLEVQSTALVATYGSSVKNYVFVGSREKGVTSADNPLATSFKNDQNQWPQKVDTAQSTLPAERLAALRKMLETSGFQDFGYIATANELTWSSASDASLVKTGCGDRSSETGFIKDGLSAVNDEGSMEYRLTFSNLSSTDSFINTTFLDVLPFVNDQTDAGADRGSKWSMIFDAVQSVTIVNADGTSSVLDPALYKVYYYTKTIDENNIQSVYDQVADLRYDTSPLPGWTNVAKGNNVTAFAVALHSNCVLESGQSCIVQYKLDVGDLTEEELAERSWNNTVNDFVCHFYKYAQDPDKATAVTLNSNSVSATILPGYVKVGGHIWIDVDEDGVWDQGESVSELNDHAIVQNILNNVEIRLYSYAGNNTNYSLVGEYKKDQDTNWMQDANFVFDKLDSAAPREGVQESALYNGTDPINLLNPALLKGTAPTTYRIAAAFPATSGVLVTATNLGSTTGKSREPALLETTYEGETADNNFKDVSAGGTGSTTNLISERFFLHSTEESVYDNSKDVGLKVMRNLTINKVAADNDSSIQGATFTVYGPFAEGTDYTTIDWSKQAKQEVTTDANGQATLSNLSWFQEYVIVETKSGSGFRLDGASAESDDNIVEALSGTSLQNPAWVLKVPDATVSETNQEIEVSNTRVVEYHLEATKKLTGKTLTDNMFEFELLNQSMQPITGQTKKNVGEKVTFSNITATKQGEVIYYIREKIPAEAANNGNQYKGYIYDSRMYMAKVSITEDPDTRNLVASTTYYIQDQSGKWVAAPDGAVFENIYAATPAEYAPTVEKTFAAGSETPVAGDRFTFELALDTGSKDDVVLPADTTVTVEGAGKANFGAIQFLKEGTYTFTITEKADPTLEGFGYEFDTTEWTLTVETKDVDGVITIQSHKYTAKGQTDSDEQATFENNYDPRFVSYAPVVSKQVTGETPDSKQTFHFTLRLMTQNPVGAVFMPEKTETSVEGAGIATFDEIRFRSAGTYTFTIVEKQENVSGYTYDARTWTLTVKVAEKLFSDELEVTSIEYLATDGTKRDDAAEFINEYHKERFPEDSHPPEEGGSTPPAPVVTIPQTEDSFPLSAVIAALVVSLAALIAIPIIRKRRGKK